MRCRDRRRCTQMKLYTCNELRVANDYIGVKRALPVIATIQERKVMNNRQILASAILAAIALPAISQAAPAPTPKFDAEKCYGVNAKGSNDCAGKAHACAGQSTR